MTTVQHPTAVVIAPRVPRRDRSWSPAFSRRLPVLVDGRTAPHTAVDYSAFHGVGRDVTHALPHMWRYQALAIADKLSIVGWPFGVRKTLGAMVVPGSRVGGMNPIQERTQVIAPRPVSLSSRAAVYPEPVYDPRYAKIL